jgi:hypothetical protein
MTAPRLVCIQCCRRFRDPGQHRCQECQAQHGRATDKKP